MTGGIPAVAHVSAEQVVTELYQLQRLGLIGKALVLTGDRPTAEDVMQEAFAGLYRAMPRLADPDKALGYVRASVINGCRLAELAVGRGDLLARCAGLGVGTTKATWTRTITCVQPSCALRRAPTPALSRTGSTWVVSEHATSPRNTVPDRPTDDGEVTPCTAELRLP